MKDEDELCQEMFKSIYAVLFFGVPNQGFRVNHWLAMVKGQPNENLILSLGLNSTYLRDLHRDFRNAFDFQDSQIVCVYETKQTRVAKVRAYPSFSFYFTTNIATTGGSTWNVEADGRFRNPRPSKPGDRRSSEIARLSRDPHSAEPLRHGQILEPV